MDRKRPDDMDVPLEENPWEPSTLIARESRQRRRLAALLEVSKVIASSLDPQIILENVAKKMSDIVGATEVTIFGLDEETGTLRPLVADVEERYYEEVMNVRLRVGQGITGHIVQTGVGEIVGHAEKDPRGVVLDGTPPDEATSLLCAPFFVQDRVVGVITLSRYGIDQFTAEDLEYVTIFAGHCSVAIANARLYEDLRKAFEELRATQTQLVQSAKLNALGEMASGVAHDFNNLLAAILGRTQLLLTKVADTEFRRSLELIEQTARDGAQTVRRIQEFTRLRLDEVFDAVDANEILRDVLEMTRSSWETQARDRGVGIRVRTELADVAPVAGNPGEMREVVTNLILNAVDAMPRGGDLVLASRSEGDRVVLEVTDTGEGMDEATQGRIFDPFFTTKALKGTGLGLSVAYGIVSRHRGTIAVRSAPHEGTTFTLSFPALTALPRPLVPAAVADGVNRFRVLVVDDEPAVLSVLGELLEALGHSVSMAEGGRAGLAALAAGPGAPQVVFTDLGMPDVSGWEVARAAKELSPDTVVVLVTGWGVQIDLTAARAKGVDYLLTKPFTVNDVRGALAYAGAAERRAA